MKSNYSHNRVLGAEYRIRKMNNTELYSVTEFYQGDRVQLCNNKLTFEDAHKLANKLSKRKSF